MAIDEYRAISIEHCRTSSDTVDHKESPMRVDESKIIGQPSMNKYLTAAFKARGLAVSHSASANTVFRLLELVIGQSSYKFCIVIENNGRQWASNLGSFESYDGEYVPMFSVYEHGDEYTEDARLIADIMKEHNAVIVEYSYPQGIRETLSEEHQYNFLYHVARMWYQIRLAYKSSFIIRPEIQLLEIFDPIFEDGGPKNHDIKGASWMVRGTFSDFRNIIPEDLVEGATTLGIKMYPTRNIHTMTTLPLVTPYNEIYCLQLCNKFIRDNIGISFPQYYGNLVVDGGNVHLFQNSGILERFQNNAETLEQMEKLAQSMDMQMDAIAREQFESSQKMLRDITLMNGRVMIIYMQHMMGWSPWNVRHVFNERYGPLETQIFIFDIVYALYLLGLNYVFHSDLHVGNIIHQAMPLHFRRITYHRFTLPRPSREMSEFISDVNTANAAEITGAGDDPEVHAVYDPERNLTADVFMTSTKFGEYGAEPIRPTYKHGEMTLMRPNVIYMTSIIDFSRAIVMNPDAFDGVQPYRAELLARNFQQIYGVLRAAVGDEFLATLENIGTELKFTAACEDNMAVAFRAIEGLDMYMLFKKLTEMDHGMGEPQKLPAFQATLRTINANMMRSLRARLKLFDRGDVEILSTMESLYPAIIDRFCPIMREPNCYTIEGVTVDMAAKAIANEKNDPTDVRFVYEFRA